MQDYPPYEAVPVTQTSVKPVRFVVLDKASGHYFVDFGQDSFSSLWLRFDEIIPGQKVVVHLAEKNEGDSADRKPPGCIRYQKLQVLLKAGQKDYPLFPVYGRRQPVTAQKATGEVMPFRYVEIENAPQDFQANNIWQRMSHVPFDNGMASFESSCSELDAVWKLCRHTIKATSAFGIYIDGDRERKPYEADAFIAMLGGFCVGAQYELGRVTHEYLLAHPTWPTEWIQHSVLMGWNHYLYSGDPRSLQKNYDVIQSKLMLDRRMPNGLFHGYVNPKMFPHADIVDWPSFYRDGYDMTVQVNSVVTAFHYHTLVLMAKIAEATGQPKAEQEQLLKMASQTHDAFNKCLWNEHQGCYVDGLHEDGSQSKHVAVHGNFFPLALGMVPTGRVPKVVEYLKSRKMESGGFPCGVYAAQYAMEAFYVAGEDDYVMQLLTCNATNSWRNMISDGFTMTSEVWGLNSGKSNFTTNHVWGAAPANIIPRRLLGVRPVKPGFVEFLVQPMLGTLKSAKGSVPTPHGMIVVDVTEKTTSDFKMSLVVPQGTLARIGVPAMGGSSDIVIVNGVQTHAIVSGTTLWVNNVMPGSYKIEHSVSRPIPTPNRSAVKEIGDQNGIVGYLWRSAKGAGASLWALVIFWWLCWTQVFCEGHQPEASDGNLVDALLEMESP